jgi:hypothetical protein
MSAYAEFWFTSVQAKKLIYFLHDVIRSVVTDFSWTSFCAPEILSCIETYEVYQTVIPSHRKRPI